MNVTLSLAMLVVAVVFAVLLGVVAGLYAFYRYWSWVLNDESALNNFVRLVDAKKVRWLCRHLSLEQAKVAIDEISIAIEKQDPQGSLRSIPSSYPVVRRPVDKSVGTVTRKISDLIAAGEDSPLPLSVIPNYMGINLCSVDSVSWTRQGDGQLVDLTIHFIPAPPLDADPAPPLAA